MSPWRPSFVHASAACLSPVPPWARECACNMVGGRKNGEVPAGIETTFH